MAKGENKVLTESEASDLLRNHFGSDAVVMPGEVSKAEIVRTGSPSLDRAIGVGGWPRGRLIQLAGAPSSGKTLMALLAIANWQREHPENCAAFLDAEFTYSPEWAAKLGVDNDRVLLIKSNDAARLFTGLVGGVKKNSATGKTTPIPGLLDMIKEGQMYGWIHPVTKNKISLNLGRMGVIVLDSIANIQVPQEIEADAGKALVAPIARFLTTELKKLTPKISEANVVMIGINQVRVNVGQMFGNPETTPGGKALKHACSIMVEVGPISGVDNLILDAKEEKQGHKIRAKVTKNKLGSPLKVGEFFVDFRSGITKVEEELLDLGAKLELFERPNNRSYVINGEKLSSRDLAIDFIRERRADLEEAVRSHYLSGHDYVRSSEIDKEVVQDPFADDESEDVA